jgi:predicted ATPase
VRAYEEVGYRVREVWKGSVEERVEWVAELIKRS